MIRAQGRGDIQLTTTVPLPSKVRGDILRKAGKLLDRHRQSFGTALLHLYVKNANSRIGCAANLFTDDGRYHTYVEDWDIRRAVSDSMDVLHVQIVKHFEKRETARTSMTT